MLRMKISETNSELKASIKRLQTTVDALESKIAEKDKEILSKKTEISELNDAIAKEAEDKQFMQVRELTILKSIPELLFILSLHFCNEGVRH